MTVTQFKYVIEAAQVGSISQAAGNLFMSQSVLSSAIKRLEEELGSPIFFRSNKGIELTSFGKDFVTYIKPITLQIDQLNSMMDHKEAKRQMNFSIVSSGFHFIGEILSELYEKKREDGIRISIYEGSIEEITDMVHNQTAEIGLMRQWSCYKSVGEKRLEALGIHFSPIITLDIGVTVGPNNPLFYSVSDYVEREALKNYPAIMYNYLDKGPYADIYTKLRLPRSASRFVTSSRATVYDILGHTDASYMNSLYYKYAATVNSDNVPFPQRTLLLKDCGIKSNLGWINRVDRELSAIACEVRDAVTKQIQRNAGL